MKGVLIDSCIILDVFEDDPKWVDWSETMLNQYSYSHNLFINPIIYSEISIGFKHIEEVEKAVIDCGFQMLQIPKESLFLAGKVFLKYRKRKGSKVLPLPNFFIGAHAAVENIELLTRDIARFKTYFPTVKLITPKKGVY